MGKAVTKSTEKKPISRASRKKRLSSYEDVVVEAWGGELVRVAPVSTRVSMDYFDRQAETKDLEEGPELSKANTETMMWLIQHSIIEESGELVFDGDEGFDDLLALPSAGALELMEAITRVNGWDVVEAAKDKTPEQQKQEADDERKNDSRETAT